MKAQLPVLTLALAAAAVVLGGMSDLATALQYERDAVQAGAWWRGLTAHLTHFDANHLAWDVAVLLALGAWCEAQSRLRMLVTLVLAAPAISAAVFCWQPQFAVYRGLSGLDCAWFGLAAGGLLRRPSRAARLVALAAAAGFLGKTLVELRAGSTVFATGGSYAPVPLAHIVGFAAGAVTALWPASRRGTPGDPAAPLTWLRRKPC